MNFEPKPAVHLRDLPREDRGFLVPAEAPWVDGKPFVAQTHAMGKFAYRELPLHIGTVEVTYPFCGPQVVQGSISVSSRSQGVGASRARFGVGDVESAREPVIDEAAAAFGASAGG